MSTTFNLFLYPVLTFISAVTYPSMLFTTFSHPSDILILSPLLIPCPICSLSPYTFALSAYPFREQVELATESLEAQTVKLAEVEILLSKAIEVHTHVIMHAHTHTHTHTHTRTHTVTCTHTYMSTCTHTHCKLVYQQIAVLVVENTSQALLCLSVTPHPYTPPIHTSRPLPVHCLHVNSNTAPFHSSP